MKLRNLKSRRYAEEAGVEFWRVAEAMGITDSWLSRKLRREFTEEQAREFRLAVDQAAHAKKMESERR